jgi:sugar phosphate isomerase/epimerase
MEPDMAFNYQLYSSRNFPPLADTLRMLKAAGYAGVEGFGAMYPDEATAASIAALLAETGMAMPTGHFGLDEIEGDPARVMRMARALGIGTILCPWIAPDLRPTDAAGWRAFGARLAKAGAPLVAEGFGFGWHNHDFEFRPLPGGAIPHDLMFAEAPSLGWEIDVAWIVRGGQDPLPFIAAYGDRILTAHVKDIAPAGDKADEDGWADVGTGVIAWPTVYKALRATPCAHFIMEHDNPSDHARFARVSIGNAKGWQA